MLRAAPWLVAVLASLSLAAAAAAQEPSLESKVKATYLAKFGNYVDWPASAYASPASAFTLCVVGDDRLGSAAEQAAAGLHVGERRIVIRRVEAVTKDSGCQLLYIGGANAQALATAIATLHGSPVLTVTDADVPGDSGAIIHFVIKDNRVRFDIDDLAAAQNGLTISSKLLSLALSVKPRT